MYARKSANLSGELRTLIEVAYLSAGVRGLRWRLGWESPKDDIRRPGRSESLRQRTPCPWMRELQVLVDDAGLDDVALAVDRGCVKTLIILIA